MHGETRSPTETRVVCTYIHHDCFFPMINWEVREKNGEGEENAVSENVGGIRV